MNQIILEMNTRISYLMYTLEIEVRQKDI